MSPGTRILRFARSGILAGAVSVLVFTAVHQLLISDIWFSFVPMLIAGAVCGAALGATYGLLVAAPSAGGWFAFNGLYVLLLVILGIVSEVVFEPVTTAAAVLAANQPPEELFEQSLPFMGLYTLAATALLSAIYGRRLRQVLALLVTTTVLMAALGMNVGIFGLVEIPTSALPLIGMLFVLVCVLAGVFAATFAVLERRLVLATPDSP